jgi:hypothetical protein
MAFSLLYTKKSLRREGFQITLKMLTIVSAAWVTIFAFVYQLKVPLWMYFFMSPPCCPKKLSNNCGQRIAKYGQKQQNSHDADKQTFGS